MKKTISEDGVEVFVAQKRSNAWMFTLNNPISADISELLAESGKVQFAIWQEEVAPTTGTPHLQGYVITKAYGTIKSVKQLLPSAHWEARRGTHEQAVAYVTKGKLFTTCGMCGVKHSDGYPVLWWKDWEKDYYVCERTGGHYVQAMF